MCGLWSLRTCSYFGVRREKCLCTTTCGLLVLFHVRGMTGAALTCWWMVSGRPLNCPSSSSLPWICSFPVVMLLADLQNRSPLTSGNLKTISLCQGSSPSHFQSGFVLLCVQLWLFFTRSRKFWFHRSSLYNKWENSLKCSDLLGNAECGYMGSIARGLKGEQGVGQEGKLLQQGRFGFTSHGRFS